MKQALLWILLTSFVQAEAQIPRNASGSFEYTHILTVDPSVLPSLDDKAKAFFRQPFLVHWDSVWTATQNSQLHITGRGYIDIRVNHGLSRTIFPVQLQFEMVTNDNSYHYTIHQLVANRKNSSYQFPLEEKPPGVKAVVYDQLLEKTHRYMVRLIAYMKKEMGGEE